jgi:dipeptidyl aminopeptidase/acylaminoacyl peptidase
MRSRTAEVCCLWAMILGLGGQVFAQQIQGAGFDPEPVELRAQIPAIRRPVTPRDLLSLRDPQGVSISLDGKQIAFVVGQAIADTNSYRSGLFVVATEGDKSVRSFGSAGTPHWDEINQWVPEAPQWSSDSREIRYRMRMSDREHFQVWGWDVATGARKQISHVNGDVESYRRLADDSALILQVQTLSSEGQIANWAEHGILLDAEISPYRSVSVLAQKVQARQAHEYWIHDSKTGIERRATLEEIRKWFPRAENEASETVGGTKTSASEKYKIVDAKPSPNGKRIAYLYLVDDPAVSKTWCRRLLIRPSAGSRLVEVTPDSYFVDQYWWSADGSTLYFTERAGLGRSPWLQELSGNDLHPRPLYRTNHPEFISYFSSDAQGRRFACLWENNTSPPEIAILDVVSQQLTKLVDLNPEFTSLRLSPAERLEGTNRLGESWYGYLVKPLDYVDGRKYPLVVTTYRSGDFFLRGASGDENPIQVYAAKGFVVLSFDVGLSRNVRPAEFDDKLLDWASSVASIESAIESLIARALVDRERVGISGFSHGEEIAGYAITHTRLFRAASSAQMYDPCFYGLGGEAWHGLFAQWGLAGWTEGSTKASWQQIAISMNADKVNTAILQNLSDTEYVGDMPTYRALKDLGKPIEVYIYPNELHVRNQPKHKLEIYERNVDWFSFWLMNEEDSDPAKADQFTRWRGLRSAAEKSAGPNR